MACFMMTSSHYLMRCWYMMYDIINEIHRSTFQYILMDMIFYNQYSLYENNFHWDGWVVMVCCSIHPSQVEIDINVYSLPSFWAPVHCTPWLLLPIRVFSSLFRKKPWQIFKLYMIGPLWGIYLPAYFLCICSMVNAELWAEALWNFETSFCLFESPPGGRAMTINNHSSLAYIYQAIVMNSSLFPGLMSWNLPNLCKMSFRNCVLNPDPLINTGPER